jgi:PqqD family protein of HPr-rel-A system
MNPNTRWQSISNIEQFAAPEDDDSIIYNPLSGETHQLNLMAIDALNFLQQPRTLKSLTEHICLVYQTDSVDDINQHMTHLIAQFDDLGLIEAYHA